jgi:hypothetical protein
MRKPKMALSRQTYRGPKLTISVLSVRCLSTNISVWLTTLTKVLRLCPIDAVTIAWVQSWSPSTSIYRGVRGPVYGPCYSLNVPYRCHSQTATVPSPLQRLTGCGESSRVTRSKSTDWMHRLHAVHGVSRSAPRGPNHLSCKLVIILSSRWIP